MQLIESKALDRVEIALSPDADKRKTELLEQAEMVQAVTSPQSQVFAVEVQRELAGYLKQVELTRTAVKAPFRQMAERVDAIAKDHVAQLAAELDRIKALVSDYQAAELVKEKERLRLLDEERERIRRKAEEAQREADRIAREAEEKRRAEMEAAARQARAEAAQRLAEEEAKRKVEVEAARKKGAEEAAVAQAKADAERKAARDREEAEFRRKEKEMQERQAEQRRKEAADAEAQQKRFAQQEMAAIAATPNRPRVSGQIVSQQWTHEVLDPKAVYAVRPDLCEVTVRASAVKEAIRQGMRECAGLRIFEAVKASVRT